MTIDAVNLATGVRTTETQTGGSGGYQMPVAPNADYQVTATQNGQVVSQPDSPRRRREQSRSTSSSTPPAPSPRPAPPPRGPGGPGPGPVRSADARPGSRRPTPAPTPPRLPRPPRPRPAPPAAPRSTRRRPRAGVPLAPVATLAPTLTPSSRPARSSDRVRDPSIDRAPEPGSRATFARSRVRLARDRTARPEGRPGRVSCVHETARPQGGPEVVEHDVLGRI